MSVDGNLIKREGFHLNHRTPVAGYQGTDAIIFLGINPSTGTFPDWKVETYYDALKEYGFGEAHLTDCFKLRHKSWKALTQDSLLIKEARDDLMEEIKIIQPRLIVLVGKQYFDFCQGFLDGVNIELFPISHYSFRYGTKETLTEKIRSEIRRVKDNFVGRNGD